MNNQNHEKSPPDTGGTNEMDDAFPSTVIGRTFAALNLELKRDQPRAAEISQIIDRLRTGLNQHDKRWNDILRDAREVLTITSDRQKLAQGSPAELQQFLSHLETVLRLLPNVETEDPRFTETL